MEKEESRTRFFVSSPSGIFPIRHFCHAEPTDET
jgi:hypothetical protein